VSRWASAGSGCTGQLDAAGPAAAGAARLAHRGYYLALAEAGAPHLVAASGEAVTALTPREGEVLKLVAQGLSNADIARSLF
jgi:DNA-binding NarL/FixJ family response regulator